MTKKQRAALRRAVERDPSLTVAQLAAMFGTGEGAIYNNLGKLGLKGPDSIRARARRIAGLVSKAEKILSNA